MPDKRKNEVRQDVHREMDIGRTRSGLRFGYTTGSCAAAAAKAAAQMLLSGEEVPHVSLQTPKGIRLYLDVEDIVRGISSVSCAVRKFSGDDPDVTDQALIYASVCRADGESPGEHEMTAEYDGLLLRLDGGEGVGRVTRHGMEQEVGQAAINEVPRRMIFDALREVCESFGYRGALKVCISIPEGERLAAQTFNPRLGICGGLSILGTSGIVEPMSEKALTDTIWLEMKMLSDTGHKSCYIVPGNYGAAFMKESLGVDPDLAVKCSNYVGEAIDDARLLEMESVLLIGHVGKFIKLAAGIMNTHSHQADGRMEVFAAHAAAAGADRELVRDILGCINTTEAVERLSAAGLLDEVMDSVVKRIDFYLKSRAGENLQIGAILFSNEAGVLGRTEEAERILEKMMREESAPTVGTFTGVGVGPGDPELLTVKAVRAIRESGCIAVPVSDRAFGDPVYVSSARERERYQQDLDRCTAYGIALDAVPEIKDKPVLLLPMPMVKDRDALCAVHDRDAEAVTELLDRGENVLFLTLGDPTVYSTCMYVHRRLKRAGYPTALIPGVPSFCAAAARLDMPLVENKEELHILPASYGLGENLQLPGTKVLMKSGRKLPEIQSALREGEREVCMVENCGMPSEKVWHGAWEIPEQSGYYSLLIVKDKKRRDET